MTPEVSAIVRELRARNANIRSPLIDSLTDEIEAGTFVRAEVAPVVAPVKVGDRWDNLTNEQRMSLPVGTRLMFIGEPGTRTKTIDGLWLCDDFGGAITNGSILGSRIIACLPPKANQ